MRILVVEDHPEQADAIRDALEGQGYAVDLAPDGNAARGLVLEHDYDLVVLDREIPAPNGDRLLRGWRDRNRSFPVLMLTARRSVRDRVVALDTGADDLLVKPFAIAEFLARVRSLLRRRERLFIERLVAGDLELERRTREVRLAGQRVHLSPKEFAVLELLLLHRDQVVSRQAIVEHAWDHRFDSQSNVVDVMLHRLRRKIDGDRPEKLLRTVPGAGYVIHSRRRR